MASSRSRITRICKCGKVQLVQMKDLHRMCKKCAGRQRWVDFVVKTTGVVPPIGPKRIRSHLKYRETPKIVAKPHPNMVGVRYEDVSLKRSISNPINGDALARAVVKATPCGNSIVMCMES